MDYQYLIPADFDQFWTAVTALTGMVGLILIIAQLWYVTRQIKRTRHQFELSQSAETSRLFIEVMDRWAAQYENRCSLLAKVATTAEALKGRFEGPSDLLAGDEWQQEIRPILNFFEFLGVLLNNDKLDKDDIREKIFTLVTVDVYPNQTYVRENGTLYQHLMPYVKYLRDTYRTDIYEYYDKQLVPKYIEYQEAKAKAKAAAQRNLSLIHI